MILSKTLLQPMLKNKIKESTMVYIMILLLGVLFYILIVLVNLKNIMLEEQNSTNVQQNVTKLNKEKESK
jgi:lipoprotein signal peptidase